MVVAEVAVVPARWARTATPYSLIFGDFFKSRSGPTDGRTDGGSDGRTDPLTERRGRI